MTNVKFKATAWRWLVLAHRWLGIATCVFITLWFASGLVMLYVAFPDYSRAERLARLAPIDWSAVRVSPQQALELLQLESFPREFRLEMLDGEPVYRVQVGSHPATISAVTGVLVSNFGAHQARALVERATQQRVARVTTLERDQWTVAGSFHAHRPLHRVALADPAGLELYVSSQTGEIVLDTTRRERAWNWAGAVMHWLYFTPLRANGPLWSQTVMWLSGAGIVVAFSGLWLGIKRVRLRGVNREASITPFRRWMAWHHLAGLMGGVFVLTWVFSGWLSMGPPVPWERPFDPARRAAALEVLAGHSAAKFELSAAARQHAAELGAREAQFVWVLGEPQLVLSDVQGRHVLHAVAGTPRTFDEQQFIALAPQLMPDAALTVAHVLGQEDAYWYSRRAERVLPVLRMEFADADRTWLHIDLATGRLVGWMRHSDRIHRWLFNALHSFDFRWLVQQRPLWDAVVWVLSLLGLVISVTGVVIGWRALRR